MNSRLRVEHVMYDAEFKSIPLFLRFYESNDEGNSFIILSICFVSCVFQLNLKENSFISVVPFLL